MGRGLAVMMSLLALVKGTASTGNCWDQQPATWYVPGIPPGKTASQTLGQGNLRVNCLGGIVTSSGKTPAWELALRLVGGGAGGGDVVLPATYLVNSSMPYTPQIFSSNVSDAVWELEMKSLNNFLYVVVNLTIDVDLSLEPFMTPAPSAVPQFNEDIARSALIYAAASYAVPEDVVSWNLSDYCMTQTQGFKMSAVIDGQNHSIFTPFGYIGVDSERKWIVVSFKGTNGTSDTVTDLIQIFKGALYYQFRCPINAYIQANTHSGFCQDYKILQGLGVLERVMKLMQQLPDYTVMVTGHSLGGALATLFHVDLTTTLRAAGPQGWDRRLLGYTFGQPRVGDPGLAFNTPPRIYRVVNADDAVPHLCPCCASGSLCLRAETCPYHIPQEVWYRNASMQPGHYSLCAASDGEDISCSDSLSMPMSVSSHLYYYSVRVGDVCYHNASLADREARIRETQAWKLAQSEEEKQRRLVELRQLYI